MYRNFLQEMSNTGRVLYREVKCPQSLNFHGTEKAKKVRQQRSKKT